MAKKSGVQYARGNGVPGLPSRSSHSDFGKPLTGGPEVGEATADKVDPLLFLLRVFAVEVRLPAADDAQEELFRITGLKVVPNLIRKFLKSSELAEFLQNGAEKERIFRVGGSDQLTS